MHIHHPLIFYYHELLKLKVVVPPHYDRLGKYFDVERKEKKYQDKIIHLEKEYHFDVNDIQNDHHQQWKQVEQVKQGGTGETRWNR